MRLKFKHPPINELIVGVYFGSEIAPLHAEHVGVFWSSIRKEFPKIQQQPILSVPPTAAVAAGLFELSFSTELFPMPRYWLEARDDSYLMQIQRDAFIFNWRKRGTDYPHFDAVKATFDQNYLRYCEFLNTEFKITQLPISVAELTYVNLIESCEYWQGVEDTSKVLPGFRTVSGRSEGVDPRNMGFNQVLVEQYAPDLAIRTTVRNALKETTPLLIFEIRCTGRQDDPSKSAVDVWYHKAHELIGQCFLNMTSPEIQSRYWQPIE
jgi:uncharacterized protein (TIGR04255 family)